MTKVISIINLKGGVGKTQMTVALAEFLALEHNKKVLVIDLDPQTNATVSLMDEEKWRIKNKNGETIYQLFLDKLPPYSNKFDINKALVNNVSNIAGGIKNLDLLPSSIDLVKIQDNLLSIAQDTGDPASVLKKEIDKVSKKYDYILIDCPPNLGMITKNGLFFSDYYLIPCIPDILSTYGIPIILETVGHFASERRLNLRPLRIVVAMYRAQTKLHNSVLQTLEEKANEKNIEKRYPQKFKTIIPLAIKAAEAAEFSATVNTLKQKYGYGGLYESYSELAKEFLEYV